MSQQQERQPRRFYGKYRGKVSDNMDPRGLGRIRAKVPAVLVDQECGWALPSSPYAGNGVGFFFVPPNDANVWIEFEGGNLNYPIWSGCFWDTGETPQAQTPAIPQVKVIKTDTAMITLNDTPGEGGTTIETISGLKITLDVSGITISNGANSVSITSASVSINDGALEVV
jgi:hypothetical protein